MEIGTHEIIKIIEETEIGETVGMADPITRMTDAIIEVEETAMIEIEVEATVEIITVETEGQAHHTTTGHGAQEVLQEDEIIVVTIETDMTDIKDDLVKARGERKKDIIIRIITKRTINQNSNSHGNG